MAHFSSINVHSCDRIRAKADYAIDDPLNTAWLSLKFDDGHMCVTHIFMPYERAEHLAAAINAAEESYRERASRPLPGPAKDHVTEGDLPRPPREDETAEHRLSRAQLGL